MTTTIETILRPYQRDCMAKVFAEFDSGRRSTLVVKPTGTGKTVTFSAIAKEWLARHSSRVLILAHREELIRQAAGKLEAITGVVPGIEMAEEYSAEKSMWRPEIVVSSIPTISRERRLARFAQDGFGLVVVDEAHHATAETYRRVLDHFTAGGCRVLGVTATPDRADELALGNVFESVAYDYELPDAITDGWLVSIDQRFVVCDGLDLSGVRTTAGDLNGSDLARIVEGEAALHQVVYPTIELAGDSQSLVFAATVQHAEKMAEIFNRHRLGSAVCVHGETPKDQRAEVLRRYSRGEFQVLCNCGVFLEGFDEPRISVVAMARPTKSRSLYAQAVGRGTRPLPGVVDGLDTPEARRAAIAASGKPSVLVLDFVGNSGRHKLISAADILGGRDSDDVVERARSNAAKKSANGESADMLEELAQAREEIEHEERRKRSQIKPEVRFSSGRVDPFDVLDVRVGREPGWHKGRQPTDRMRDALKKFRVEDKVIDALSYHKASQMLDALCKRADEGKCSLKQATLLRKYGYSQDATFEEARSIIDVIAANGWKRPRDAQPAAATPVSPPSGQHELQTTQDGGWF